MGRRRGRDGKPEPSEPELSAVCGLQRPADDRSGGQEGVHTSLICPNGPSVPNRRYRPTREETAQELHIEVKSRSYCCVSPYAPVAQVDRAAVS